MRIVGNTVGTTLPKPNFDQTDPSKGDFIKGDRTFVKGDKGDKGDTGPQGEQGIQGEQGPAGEAGYTPVKGTDYYTEEDKTEMVEAVLDSIPKLTNVKTVRDANQTTMTLSMNDGKTSTIVIDYADNGDPSTITVDGEEVTLEFIYNMLHLFNNGDLCETITGGWQTNGYCTGETTDWGDPTMVITDGAMNISRETNKNYFGGSVFTVNEIDLTNFSKLNFNVTAVVGEVHIGIAKPASRIFQFTREIVPTFGLNTIDISDITGSYTVAITVIATSSVPVNMTIDSIYLE